jgi:hypothetical protein
MVTFAFNFVYLSRKDVAAFLVGKLRRHDPTIYTCLSEAGNVCIEGVVIYDHCCVNCFSVCFFRWGGSEKRILGIPAGLWQKQLLLSPVFKIINDLFEEAPSQHDRITSKP